MKAYLTLRNAVAAAVAIGVAAAASANMAAAATIVSEVPFQRHLQLTCVTGNSSCSGIIGPVAVKQRLVIQFVSCTGDGGVGSTLRNFSASVADNTKLVGRHYIAPTYRSAEEPYIYVASQPILLTVPEGNILVLSSVSIGGTFNVACGVSGVRQTFQ
jgi:hypothetical protein